MNPESAKSMIGLSFHPDQVCIVEVSDGIVQKLASRELVQSFDLEAMHSDDRFVDHMAEILQDLIQRADVQVSDVGVALDGSMVLIKKVPLALGLEEKMIREQMRWEAEQLLISNPGDFIIESQRLPFQTPLANPYYILILVRKRVMESVQKIIANCGLRLIDVDVSGFCAVRSLLANYEVGQEETVAIVDLQRQFIAFTFIQQREYFLSSRTFLMDGASAPQNRNSGDIANLIGKELRRLTFGHRLGRGIEDLNQVFIMGGENVQQIAHTFSEAGEVSSNIMNPFSRIQVSPEVSELKEFNNFPERFVSSVGVTLKS